MTPDRLYEIRDRRDEGDTVYAASDRHALLDHIDALNATTKRAQAQALRDVLRELFHLDEDPGIEEIESIIRTRADELDQR